MDKEFPMLSKLNEKGRPQTIGHSSNLMISDTRETACYKRPRKNFRMRSSPAIQLSL